MKFEIRFLLFLFLAVAPFVQIGASMPDSSTVMPPTSDVRATPGFHAKMKKPGLFQQIRAIKAIKKYGKEQGREGEMASKMARVALLLFIGSSVVGSVGVVQLSVVFFAIFVAAFITSIVLGIIVLVREDNPKSRKLARLILIISGIELAATAILLVLLLGYFNAH